MRVCVGGGGGEGKRKVREWRVMKCVCVCVCECMRVSMRVCERRIGAAGEKRTIRERWQEGAGRWGAEKIKKTNMRRRQ